MGSCVSKENVPQNEQSMSRTQKNSNAHKLSISSNSPQDNSIPSQNDQSSNISNNEKSPSLQHALNGSGPNNSNTNNNGDVQYKNSNMNLNSNSNNKEIKILLLGSGESGKSTIIKQMKILHQNGYTKQELYDYKPFVYRNVMECIKNILTAMIDLSPEMIENLPEKEIEEKEIDQGGNIVINIHTPEGEEKEADLTQLTKTTSSTLPKIAYSDIEVILNYEPPIDPNENIDYQLTRKITQIYRSQTIQSFLTTNKAKFYLMDSSKYFFDSLPRIGSPDYVPTTSDILRTRKKTSGIFDTKFTMGGLKIHMYDVGGQRSERKKWIHCFDNVTLIIFCVALSEYNQVLLEESSQNRLEESLILFDSVVNSRWFLRTAIVLFLNKVDVFAEKLSSIPLGDYFPDYTGGTDINKAAKYILWRFTQVNRAGLNIYPHVTQATDTGNIRLVFAAVKETILENSLRDSGIL